MKEKIIMVMVFAGTVMNVMVKELAVFQDFAKVLLDLPVDSADF